MISNPNGGATKFASAYGDSSVQTGAALAFDKSGNIILSGAFGGKMTLGGTTLTSAGGDDAFVAKFTAAGQPIWAKSFGDAQGQGISGVGVDTNGNVYVTGSFYGSINFGGGSLQASGEFYSDVFLAKLDPNGNHVWSARYGDDNVQNARGLAVDSAGNVVVVGYFENMVNFGGGALTSAGMLDMFVAKFNTAGMHQWSRRFGDAANSQYARAVAVDAASNVYLAGEVAGAIDFGGGSMPVTTSKSALVAKLDALGNATWVKLSSGAANSQAVAYSIAVGPNGEVAAGGSFRNMFDLGGTPVMSAGSDDAFVTLFSATGAHTFTKTFGDFEQQQVAGVAVAPNGDVFAAGDFSGTIDLETGTTFTSAGLSDGFIARLNTNGCPSWLKAYPGALAQLTQALAFDPTTGGVAATGSFLGSADFGTGTITASGSDVFLMSVNP